MWNQVKADKYDKVVSWAKKRYTINGRLTISVGGKPAQFKTIEILAWNRYMKDQNK